MAVLESMSCCTLQERGLPSRLCQRQNRPGRYDDDETHLGNLDNASCDVGDAVAYGTTPASATVLDIHARGVFLYGAVPQILKTQIQVCL